MTETDEQANPVFVAMAATVTLVGTAVAEGLQAAVHDEVIASWQADALEARFEANLKRHFDEVNGLVAAMAKPGII